VSYKFFKVFFNSLHQEADFKLKANMKLIMKGKRLNDAVVNPPPVAKRRTMTLRIKQIKD
jgi:hypothetical protein